MLPTTRASSLGALFHAHPSSTLHPRRLTTLVELSVVAVPLGTDGHHRQSPRRRQLSRVTPHGIAMNDTIQIASPYLTVVEAATYLRTTVRAARGRNRTGTCCGRGHCSPRRAAGTCACCLRGHRAGRRAAGVGNGPAAVTAPGPGGARQWAAGVGSSAVAALRRVGIGAATATAPGGARPEPAPVRFQRRSWGGNGSGARPGPATAQLRRQRHTGALRAGAGDGRGGRIVRCRHRRRRWGRGRGGARPESATGAGAEGAPGPAGRVLAILSLHQP